MSDEVRAVREGWFLDELVTPFVRGVKNRALREKWKRVDWPCMASVASTARCTACVSLLRSVRSTPTRVSECNARRWRLFVLATQGRRASHSTSSRRKDAMHYAVEVQRGAYVAFERGLSLLLFRRADGN